MNNTDNIYFKINRDDIINGVENDDVYFNCILLFAIKYSLKISFKELSKTINKNEIKWLIDFSNENHSQPFIKTLDETIHQYYDVSDVELCSYSFAEIESSSLYRTLVLLAKQVNIDYPTMIWKIMSSGLADDIVEHDPSGVRVAGNILVCQAYDIVTK